MNRCQELDAIRALAAISVLLFHLFPDRFFFLWIGVDGFFVLSGYLITGIILQHGNQPGFFKVFYLRRALRIFPIYYACIILVWSMNLIFESQPTSVPGLLRALTFTQNFETILGGSQYAFHPRFRHSWSIAVEEQFYLIWPFLVLLVARKNIPLLLPPLIILAFISRMQGFVILTSSRLDQFAIGGMVAYWLYSKRAVKNSYLLATLVLVPVYLMYMGSNYEWRVFFNVGAPDYHIGTNAFLYALFFASLVTFLVTNKDSKLTAPFRIKWLCYLGKTSYAMYLFHVPLFWLVDGGQIQLKTLGWEIPNESLIPITKMVLAITIPILSWEFIEKPLLSFKKWLPYNSDMQHHKTKKAA